jgi:poly(3-hydroxybutyrate) depolymerase
MGVFGWYGALFFTGMVLGVADASFVFTARTELAGADCTETSEMCENWPDAADGQVVLFEANETFGSESHRRAFKAYLPSRVTSGTKPVPLFIFLHGGYGSGEAQLLLRPFAKLADGREVSWRPNTATCKFQYPEGYRKADGSSCFPPRQYVQSEAFVAIFPDGLPDRGEPNDRASKSVGHWEDGRVPSPGWYVEGSSTNTQYRDDVGFIEYIIELALSERLPGGGALVDPRRVYVVGTSNGGMMTQRVACHVGDPAYPRLSHISAVGVSVASMPEPLFDGSSGRAECTPRLPLSVQYIVGNNIPTPRLTVNGDGNMPYLEAGQRAQVYSPERGVVVAHIDGKSLFIEANEALLGVSAVEDEMTPVGYFCTLTSSSFPGFDSEVQAYVTDGGHHHVAGVLFDIDPFIPSVEFAFRFQRNISLY